MAEVRRLRCPVCGGYFFARRPEAFVCSGPCRAERSRILRLLNGLPVDGFTAFSDRFYRRGRRRRTEAARGA